MKYQIEFSYKQVYLPSKRCRKEQVCFVNDIVDLEVRELEEREFPVAFVVNDYKTVYEDAKSYKDFYNSDGEYKPFAEEVRYYDGCLFKVMRIRHGTAISGRYYEPLSIISGRLKRSVYGGINKGELPESAVLIKNDRDLKVKSITAQSKQFVIYDGKLWERCGEPVYVIRTFGFGNNHGGTGFFIEYCINPQEHTDVYNALEHDMALENAKRTALNRGDTNFVDGLGKNMNIEVLMPEIVTTIPRVSEREKNNPMFQKLKPHVGHHITCISCGRSEELADICIKCEDCNEILVSTENKE